ncbi:MAG: response regulator transcription factor [Bryobacteraceae bacterium]|jgi:two-component system nitrate/nitrite response regulator NarL
MPEATRIVLIDDHALFREAIARLLAAQTDIEIIGESATVGEGLEIVKTRPVDIVLLDINLGSEQGGAFLNLARAEGFSGKVLVVTAGVSKLEASRLLQRGCAGIFLKHERPQLLIEKIREIMKGPGEFDEQEATISVATELSSGDPETGRPLTPRERQVLCGVFSGRTNKEIAHKLNVSESLIKAFVQQLFRKAGVRSRAQLVRAAVERYWKELEEDCEGTWN